MFASVRSYLVRQGTNWGACKEIEMSSNPTLTLFSLLLHECLVMTVMLLWNDFITNNDVAEETIRVVIVMRRDEIRNYGGHCVKYYRLVENTTSNCYFSR